MQKLSKISLLSIFSVGALILLIAIQYHLTTSTFKYQDRLLKREIQRATDQITVGRPVFDTLSDLRLANLHGVIKDYANLRDSLQQQLSITEDIEYQKPIQEAYHQLKLQFKDTLSQIRKIPISEKLNKYINTELRKYDINHKVVYANVIGEVMVSLDGKSVDTLFSSNNKANEGVLFAGMPFDYAEAIPISWGYVTSTDFDFDRSNGELRNQTSRNDTTGHHIAIRTLEYIQIKNWNRIVLQETWITFAAAIGSILFVMILFFVAIRSLLKQKRLNDIKTDFINNITHELQTPLATLGIATKTLQKDSILEQPQTVKDIAQTIERQHLRLHQLINQVVNQSVSASSLTLNKENIHLTSFLQDLIKDFKIKHLHDPIDYHLQISTAETAYGLDPFYMNTAINNILENAYKYNSEGVVITVNSLIKNNSWHLEISDNGMGIPHHQHHLIFDKFYRIPTGNVHNVKGLGLGLHLAKQVIEAHNGSIVLKKSDQGACFLIKISLDETSQLKQ